jgi:protein-L-isoaspartate(D-aspartate) O-methyltransferase
MDPAVLRADMVDGLVHESKGHVHCETLADAMSTVEREAFVPEEAAAYEDRSHEVLGTRVLSPSLAARVLDALALEPGHRVLVVGAGVGYTAAVAAEIAGERTVQAVDIARPLVRAARSNLARAGYSGVLVDCCDGADGLPAYAPYDRILLEAAAIEPPRALLAQLADDGRLVAPIGAQEQRLRVLDADGDTVEDRGSVAFQPMLVDGEQTAAIERNRTHREERERAAKAAESRSGWEREWIDWEKR